MTEEDPSPVAMAVLKHWIHNLQRPAGHIYAPSNIGKLLAGHEFWTVGELQCVFVQVLGMALLN